MRLARRRRVGWLRIPEDDAATPNDVTQVASATMLVLAAGSVLQASPIEMLEAAAGAGFDGVGLRLSHGRMSPAAGLREIRMRADDLGLCIHDIEVHRVGEDTDAAPLVEACAALGAPFLLAVSDLADESATIDALSALSDTAALSGVAIGLEYMAWTMPKTAIDAVRVAHAARAKIVVDVLHHHRTGGGPSELRAIVDAGLLGWVQLCDAPYGAPNDLLHEARHARLIPAQGALPLAELIAVLPPAATISVEVQSDELATNMGPQGIASALATAARSVMAAR